MKIYQCFVRGYSEFGEGRSYSRKVFLDIANAEKYLPEFEKICLTPRSGLDLFRLEEITNSSIVELECDDGEKS